MWRILTICVFLIIGIINEKDSLFEAIISAISDDEDYIDDELWEEDDYEVEGRLNRDVEEEGEKKRLDVKESGRNIENVKDMVHVRAKRREIEKLEDKKIQEEEQKIEIRGNKREYDSKARVKLNVIENVQKREELGDRKVQEKGEQKREQGLNKRMYNVRAGENLNVKENVQKIKENREKKFQEEEQKRELRINKRVYDEKVGTNLYVKNNVQEIEEIREKKFQEEAEQERDKREYVKKSTLLRKYREREKRQSKHREKTMNIMTRKIKDLLKVLLE